MRSTLRRLSDVESRGVFRALLDSLAAPGEVRFLPVCEGIASELLPLLCLADLEVALATITDSGDDIGEVLTSLTGSTATRADRADLVLARRIPLPAEVLSLPRGTALSPERGSRLVMVCAGFSRGTGVRLSGPGVDDVKRLSIEGIPVATMLAIAEANACRPCGIDTHLVTPAGALVSIPRSCSLRVEDGAWVM